MPDTTMDQARGAAERLRRLVEEIPVLPGPDMDPIHVTLSIGVSMGPGGEDGQQHPEGLLQRADQALYASKNQGRNMVSFCRFAA